MAAWGRISWGDDEPRLPQGAPKSEGFPAQGTIFLAAPFTRLGALGRDGEQVRGPPHEAKAQAFYKNHQDTLEADARVPRAEMGIPRSAMCLRIGPAPPLPVKSKAIQLIRNNANGCESLLITRASGLSTRCRSLWVRHLSSRTRSTLGVQAVYVTHKMARLLDQMYTSRARWSLCSFLLLFTPCLSLLYAPFCSPQQSAGSTEAARKNASSADKGKVFPRSATVCQKNCSMWCRFFAPLLRPFGRSGFAAGGRGRLCRSCAF